MAIQIGGTSVIDNSRNINSPSVIAQDLFTIPTRDTASRPTSPVAGIVGFNTATNQFELYDGTTWILISSSTTP
jgi:alcohol dehydrogenase YqhD (iron-dependent ADH family)